MIVSSITFDIKRDREEEMIHRGVQYSRAIRAYYKKFSRYPAKIEDLENTNQMRFLRKRYKDPLTGKDFKLLHYGEAKMSMNALAAARHCRGEHARSEWIAEPPADAEISARPAFDVWRSQRERGFGASFKFSVRTELPDS